MKNYLIVITLLITSFVSAQKEYRPGYIIKQNKDTIYGEIDYRKDLLMSKVCTFKKNNQISKFTPNDILGYRFADGKYFISREIETKTVFLEFLIKGEINVYYYLDNTKGHYYVENGEGVLRELLYGKHTIERNEAQYLKEDKRYIAILNVFLKDAPALSDQIKNIARPSHKSLIKLAKKYHETVCDTEKCIVFEGQRKKSKLMIEVVAGFSNIKEISTSYYDRLRDKKVTTVGVIAHVSIPRLGDKWYWRAGLIGHEVDYVSLGKGKENIYKIPLHIEYIHYKGLFRPKFYYGPSISNVIVVTLGAGLNIKMKKNWFLSINAEVDFESTALLIPEKAYTNSYLGGISYQF